MIQARSTTASAPRKWGTRSSLTTSAAAHSTFGTESEGVLRASPSTDSTRSSVSSERSTLVPRLPVAPTTTTLMQWPVPLCPAGETQEMGCCTIDEERDEPGRIDASTGNRSVGQGRKGDGGGVSGGRTRRAGDGPDAAGLRASRGGRG